MTMSTEFDPACALWRKSRRSGSTGDACVEVAPFPAAVGVRDSKNPEGKPLAFTPAVWQAFAEGLKAGAFDLPTSD